jgi:hypothetical protein
MFVFLLTFERLLTTGGPMRCRLVGAKRTTFTTLALLAAGVAWAGGLMLAAIPVLPSLADWRFYGSTALCVPLPCSFSHSASYRVALGGVLEGVFVLLAASGLLVVTRSLPKRSQTLP